MNNDGMIWEKHLSFNGIELFSGKVQQRGFDFTANGVTWLFNHGQVEVGRSFAST
jgi:hypothetical protein